MDELNTRILEVSPLVEECYRAQTVAFSPFEYPYIRNLIETNNIRSVLDIGTGEGTFISGLAVETPEVRYLAIDADSSLIEMAKRKHSRENITFVHALFGPSYSGDPYDMILARFTIEHVPEAVHFIAEAYNRLNPILPEIRFTSKDFAADPGFHAFGRFFRDRVWFPSCFPCHDREKAFLRCDQKLCTPLRVY